MNCFASDPTLNMDPVPTELVEEGQDSYLIVVSQKLNALLTNAAILALSGGVF